MREEDRIETLRPRGAADPARAERAPRGAERLESALAPLAPRGAGALFDLALEVLRARFATMVGIATLLWLPVRVVQQVLAERIADPAGDGANGLLALVGLFFTLFASAVVAVLSSTCIAAVVDGVLRGERVTALDAARRALRRLVPVLAITIVTGILTSVGYLMCLAPGIWLAWKLALAPSICVLEDAGVGASIRRSFDLATGSFLRWIAIVALTIALTLPFSGPVAAFDDPTVSARLLEAVGLDDPSMRWVVAVLGGLFAGLATAFSSVAMTVLYFDCRLRREGDDLRRRLELVARAEPAA